VLVVGRINGERVAAPTHVTVRHDRRDRPAIDDALRLEVPPSVGDESARLDSPIAGILRRRRSTTARTPPDRLEGGRQGP
jgi:hypothetical protein